MATLIIKEAMTGNLTRQGPPGPPGGRQLDRNPIGQEAMFCPDALDVERRGFKSTSARRASVLGQDYMGCLIVLDSTKGRPHEEWRGTHAQTFVGSGLM